MPRDAAAGPAGAADAVVLDRDRQLPLAVGDAHADGARAGVADDVGQRLLHDPVGADLELVRERAIGAVQAQLDGEAGVARGPQQLLDVLQPRRRRAARPGPDSRRTPSVRRVWPSASEVSRWMRSSAVTRHRVRRACGPAPAAWSEIALR